MRRLIARVVKLVDTGDLKSPGHCGRTGSIPVPGTKISAKSKALPVPQAAFPALIPTSSSC